MYYRNSFLKRQLRFFIFRALNKVYSWITRKISLFLGRPLRLLAYLRKSTISAFFKTPSLVVLNLSKIFQAVLASSSFENQREAEELSSFFEANSSSYWVCQILVRLLSLGSLSQRPINIFNNYAIRGVKVESKDKFRDIYFFIYAELKTSLSSRKRMR